MRRSLAALGVASILFAVYTYAAAALIEWEWVYPPYSGGGGSPTVSPGQDGERLPGRRPRIEIVEPHGPVAISPGQPVVFESRVRGFSAPWNAAGSAHWYSDVDGFLGAGDRLRVVELSPGRHTISVVAGDGRGGLMSASVPVDIGADSEDGNRPTKGLTVHPKLLHLEPSRGRTSVEVSVDNRIPGILPWQADVDQPWLGLSAYSDITPARVTVSFLETDLPTGVHRAVVTFTSPETPDVVEAVSIEVVIP